MNHIEQVYARHENEPIIDRFEHMMEELQISQQAVWDFVIDKIADKEYLLDGELDY